MRPLISVIVPVYRVEPYLRRCVDSILNQTCADLEVILVDDGSPDNCGAICDEYAQKDARVRVLHRENGGLSDARNAGMETACGAYLAFVDSDDLLPEDSLEKLLRIAREQQADLVIGGHRRFEGEPREAPVPAETVRCMTGEEAMMDFLDHGCASWARLYRRELHRDLRFPVGELNEDEAVVLPLLERCSRIAKTDAVVYHYRVRPESITTGAFRVQKLDWVKHCRENLAFLRERHPRLEQAGLERYRRSLLWALREMALSEADFPQAVRQVKLELRAQRKQLEKVGFRSGQEHFAYLLAQYAPFSVYRTVLRMRHR